MQVPRLPNRETAAATIEMREFNSRESREANLLSAGKNAAPVVAYRYADKGVVLLGLTRYGDLERLWTFELAV